MNQIFVLAILAAVVSGSLALKCYECHNYMDGNCPKDYEMECDAGATSCAFVNLNLEDLKTKENYPLKAYGCVYNFEDASSCNAAMKSVDFTIEEVRITGSGQCCEGDLCNGSMQSSKPRIPNLARYIF